MFEEDNLWMYFMLLIFAYIVE